jgi:acyl-CoA dehydrogenase
MQGLGSGPIGLFGTPEQKARWLPDVARGRAVSAFALSEREAGSDVSALATRAVRDGDHWRLDGSKTWISNAGIADLYVVFARTGEAPGAKGLSAFVVESGTPGFRVSELIDLVAPHPIGSLAFDGARVPAANMLGAPGDGFRVAMATLDVFRSTVGAAALGFARRALDEALRHAATRRLFGQPLADLQMTRARLAEMALSIDAAALLVYRAAWVKDATGARISREASMAKLFATEEAQRVIDGAVQIFGGLGVTKGHIAERLYREIRALRIYEGASEVQKVIIAGRLLDELGKAER